MKKNFPYLILLIGVMVLIGFISQRHSGRRINWEPNYRMNSRLPFGCYLTDKYLTSTLSTTPEYVDQTCYSFLGDTILSQRNYVIINRDFEPTALDVVELCRFVNEGNTVFISAGSFGMLGDSLKISAQDPIFQYMQDDTTQTMNTAMSYNSDTVRMNLVNPAVALSKSAVYDKAQISYAFLGLNSNDITILGVDASGYPNYIRYKTGKGAFLFHCMPDVFCNYYAGKRENAKYIFGALSYLPNQTTFIDTHYKLGKDDQGDSRRFVLSQPALKLAYFILIIAGAIALIFGGKRRQRAVPLLPPYRNMTLDFIEQVGALYYRQSDHSNIIGKKTNYFLESVRSRFFVSTVDIDERLVDRVTALSGVPYVEVQHLFSTIQALRTAEGERTANDLKKIESLIREFNKRSKR